MCERDNIKRDGQKSTECAKPKDVIRAYELLRYQQIKEKYGNHGSVSGQFGIEK